MAYTAQICSFLETFFAIFWLSKAGSALASPLPCLFTKTAIYWKCIVAAYLFFDRLFEVARTFLHPPLPTRDDGFSTPHTVHICGLVRKQCAAKKKKKEIGVPQMWTCLWRLRWCLQRGRPHLRLRLKTGVVL